MAADWHLLRSFEFNGQRVACDRFGAGTPVVLIHGTPFSSHVWRSIARELARDHLVHVYDLLGYGRSEQSEGQDVSLGVQNTLLAALLRYWQLDRPCVIAHDFGGATALRAHLLDGCEFERLLLIDPVAIRPWGSSFVQHVRRHEAAFAGLPDAMHRAILQAYIRGAAYRSLSDTELAPYLAPWLGATGQSAFYRQIAQMDLKYTDEVQTRYREVRCPVKLLWGAEDEWIPAERGRELAAMLQVCELIVVPGSGHLMQEDAPEAIVATALRFFARP
ncbi:MAG TPA: alpha/beta hydrolase [Acetobacteraceae bacterium]|nr:alpha/beta hydrolase [Acetobacteraceae bacterium]